MHLPRATKWTVNMDAQQKAEIFSNCKVIYDYTTGCRLRMEYLARNQTRHFTPQPKYTSKVSRRQFLWDVVMGGAKAIRLAIIKERIEMTRMNDANKQLTPATDLPFTLPSNKWEDSVFYKYQQRHPSAAPITPITPSRTRRGALRNRNGVLRVIRSSNYLK